MTKVMKKALALVLAMTMVFSTVIVSGAAKAKKNTVKIGNVAVTKTITVKKGAKVTLKSGVKLAKKDVKNSKKSVATVKVAKKKVTVKAKKVGTTKVTIAKKGYKKVTVTVKVTKKAPKKIQTSKKKAIKNVSLTVGKSKKITANQAVKAVSANKKVATVKASKKKVTITAKKAGKVKVTISAKNNAAVSKTITVTVKAAEVKVPVSADATVSADASGNAKIADFSKVTAATVSYAGKSVSLSEADVKDIVEAVKTNKVPDLAAKKLTAGASYKYDVVDAKGVKTQATVTVKTAYDAAKASAVVTYAGKDYTVKVAADKVTINATDVTYKYDAATDTLTVGTKSAKAKNVTVKVTTVK